MNVKDGKKSTEIYRKLSRLYEDAGIARFSEVFGRSMLRYFEDTGAHPENCLDLCCGTGSLCRILKDGGIDVTGIDISEDMLRKAGTANPDIAFICADITEYRPSQKYGLITCTNDSINHITERSALKDVFSMAGAALTDGGLFIFDILNRKALHAGTTYKASGTGGMAAEYLISDTGDHLVDICLTIKKDGAEALSVRSTERIYSRDDIWEMLLDAGMSLLVCTGDFYEETSPEKYKIVARRTGSAPAAYL